MITDLDLNWVAEELRGIASHFADHSSEVYVIVQVGFGELDFHETCLIVNYGSRDKLFVRIKNAKLITPVMLAR